MVLTTQSRDLSIGEALDLGVQFAMAGNNKSACTMFRGVLIHEPENFEAIERLGSSLFEMGEYHEALYWFWRGRKIDRRQPLALTNYGLCVSQLGHWEEGIEDLRRAVYQAEKNPLSNEAMALVYNNLGNTLERLKHYDEALVTLDKGIAYNPKDSFPHYNRGIVLLRLNRQHDAIASLDRALIGSRAGDLAQVLLGTDPASNFARIQAAKDSIPTIGSIFAKSAGLADASQN